MRLFSESTTYTLPSAATATARGAWNWPDPLPAEHVAGIWTFYLDSVDEHTTRLIVRNRMAYNTNAGNTLLWRMSEGLGFVMEQKMIRSLKELAES